MSNFILSFLLPHLFKILIDFQMQILQCGLTVKYEGLGFGHFHWQILRLNIYCGLKSRLLHCKFGQEAVDKV